MSRTKTNENIPAPDTSGPDDKASIVVLTGLSGSGKSVALRALEDMGYFAIDNLPVSLLAKLLELSGTHSQFKHIALVMDSRNPDFFSKFGDVYAATLSGGYNIQLIFLDAPDEVLARRYSETRRKHPYESGALMDAIRSERERFERIREMADATIDTSHYSVHELRRIIEERFGIDTDKPRMHVDLMSFGFKHGLPLEADLVFDVRFLPNPFFVPELRSFTGLEKNVAHYVLDRDETGEFIRRISELIAFLLPWYEKEGKHYLTIAVGCTGGVHRSVAIIEKLAADLPLSDHPVTVTHRELNRKKNHARD
ncbi:MAG: RNase adapter RapZ [Deltaproteobacteria bacterium]|nr:RNase adapter RapZ [bacterium]MCB9477433.1 RNase adapter RapZ [Deltaproteobacteria bacterium]MCB9478785.1 RNase adapter RapZ [Deltaproteobacteria bacterium]MCB9489053.1 RNase adapter RapZ [Deltaproteobacteria bacterium]